MTEEYTRPVVEIAPGDQVYHDGYRDPPPLATCRQSIFAKVPTEILQQRIRDLEEALLPLAARATVMQSISMNMRAAGVDPARLRPGGTWVMTDDGPQALFTDEEYFAALDAVGRERTRLYMAEQVAEIDRRIAAAEEAKKRVESGEKLN